MDKQIINSKKEYQEILSKKENLSNKISNVRLIVFLIFIITLILYFQNKLTIFKTVSYLIAVTFIFIAIYHNKVEKEKTKLKRYLEIISNYENRTNNNWYTTKITEEHKLHFMNDLDITGKNSLFDYINFTHTLGGKNKLIETLSLKKIKKENIKLNQEAISELKDNFKFNLLFQENISKIEKVDSTDYKNYFYFFDDKSKSKLPELTVSLIISTITIIVAILSSLNIINSLFFILLVFLQLLSSYVYVFLYSEEFESISKCSRIYKNLKYIYEYVDKQEFKAKKNIKLQKDIREGKCILNKLIKISDLDSYRNNFITYLLFNIFASLNFIILYKYNKLQRENNEAFKSSIKSLEELEVLISLTTICYVKENICLPKINEETSLEVTNIKHPLLNEDECISNDFKCDSNINIITGSNMSGKTSFMRTIGINLVLAYCGTYVNASQFSCSIMHLFTSINVKDDIRNGISTFYGELKRIKEVLDYSEKNKEPMIIFIDEIFKGTNYNDRILGAKETLKKLSSLNCIVFLTTHDFELCEINNKKINNYHFAEYYKENKIYFDYKIKEGRCKSTNAKYLMTEMGIIK